MSRGYVRVPQSKRGDSSYHSVWCTRRLEKVRFRSISLRGRPHGSRWVPPAQPPHHFDVFVRSIGKNVPSQYLGRIIHFFSLSLSVCPGHKKCNRFETNADDRPHYGQVRYTVGSSCRCVRALIIRTCPLCVCARVKARFENRVFIAENIRKRHGETREKYRISSNTHTQ